MPGPSADLEALAAEAFATARTLDAGRFATLVHPDAVLVPFTALAEYRGPEGAREWLESVRLRFTAWHGEFDETEVHGPCVLQHGSMEAAPRAGEQARPVRVTWLWAFRDGLVWRFQGFTGAEEARAEAQRLAALPPPGPAG